MTNSRTLYVVDRQNADGSWTGVASVWDEDADQDLLSAVADAFRLVDQNHQYRVVAKVRSQREDVQVVPNV